MALQEVNKENLFTFGVDAEEVDKLREERKNFKDYDPRWNEAFKLIYDGKFGDKEYFKVFKLHLLYSIACFVQSSTATSLAIQVAYGSQH